MKVTGWDGVLIPTKILGEIPGNDVAILVHGIFSSKDESGRFTRQAEFLHGLGLTVARYDHRCHGESTATKSSISVFDHVLDLQQVVKFVMDAGAKSVSIVASSYGGAIALLAAQAEALEGVRKFVLLNPVVGFDYSFVHPRGIQIKSVLTPAVIHALEEGKVVETINGIEFTPKFWLELQLTDPGQGLRRIADRTTVIHGSRDTAIEYDETKRRCDAAGISKFITIEGSDHAFTDIEHEVTSFQLIKMALKGQQ